MENAGMRDRKLAQCRGLAQRSIFSQGEGKAGHLKRWSVVWASVPQSGHVSGVLLRTASYDFSARQKPDRS